VSLLQTDTLQVELAPDQVILVYSERRLTLRGMRTTVWNEWLAAAASGPEEAPWRGALQALATALPSQAGGAARARVIISNRLVRYALVPWSDALGDAEEEAAFARHCFERLYGEAAAQWELRVSDERDGLPKLASAVDAALPGALREVFAAAGVRLDSIQPSLMAVYNDYRRRLRGRHAWLALLEPGSLFLALLYQGRWARVRRMRIGPGWRVELAQILEREAYLGDPEAAARDVFLWASGLGDVKLPENDRWQFHLLAPEARHDTATAAAGPMLMTAAEG
jgi:hypothetical protein